MFQSLIPHQFIILSMLCGYCMLRLGLKDLSLSRSAVPDSRELSHLHARLMKTQSQSHMGLCDKTLD